MNRDNQTMQELNNSPEFREFMHNIFDKIPQLNSNDSTNKEGTFRMGRCTVIVSKDNGKWHLSISTPNASPSYKEIKEARYKFLPNDIFVAQIFPPKEHFINIHPFCHHLWEI